MRGLNQNKPRHFEYCRTSRFSSQKWCKKRIILGLTGSFCSGKSTVAKIFGSLGAQVIDADRIAHWLIKPGGKIYKKLIDAFGKGILKENKVIDRDKLGEIVFDNKNLLERLNRLIHPQVTHTIKHKIGSSSKKAIVIDAPLLIEAGLTELVDKLVVVKVSRRKQIERALKKYKNVRGKAAFSKADILRRINAQMSLSDKVRLADFVIDNNGTIEETRKQVEQIRRQLWKD